MSEYIRVWRTLRGWSAAANYGFNRVEVNDFPTEQEAVAAVEAIGRRSPYSDWLRGYQAGLDDANCRELEY